MRRGNTGAQRPATAMPAPSHTGGTPSAPSDRRQYKRSDHIAACRGPTPEHRGGKPGPNTHFECGREQSSRYCLPGPDTDQPLSPRRLCCCTRVVTPDNPGDIRETTSSAAAVRNEPWSSDSGPALPCMLGGGRRAMIGCWVVGGRRPSRGDQEVIGWRGCQSAMAGTSAGAAGIMARRAGPRDSGHSAGLSR